MMSLKTPAAHSPSTSAPRSPEPDEATASPPQRTVSFLRPIARPEQLVSAQEELNELVERFFRDGHDYGRLPGGHGKHILLKPGAERLALSFGCRIAYDVIEQEVDHDRINQYAVAHWEDTDVKPAPDQATRLRSAGRGRWRKSPSGRWVWQVKREEKGESFGLYRYVIRCRLVRQDGLLIGEALGACSTLESRYVRAPREAENTVVKMAQKRALVAVALNAFGLSDRFTQDLDDGGPAGAKGGLSTTVPHPRPLAASVSPRLQRVPAAAC